MRTSKTPERSITLNHSIERAGVSMTKGGPSMSLLNRSNCFQKKESSSTNISTLSRKNSANARESGMLYG